MAPRPTRAFVSLVAALVALCAGPGPVPAQEGPDTRGPGAQPATARVRITSDPMDQSVVLGERRIGDTTPLELDLSPGAYRITVHGPGYQPLTHDIVVGAGEFVGLEFVLLETPPEPPTPEQLRAMAADAGLSTTPDPVDEHRWESVRRENASCAGCHPRIPDIQAAGIHRNVSCAECHDKTERHVKNGLVVGEMPMAFGSGIQVLCLSCHDVSEKTRFQAAIKTIEYPHHVRELGVDERHRCDACHHVHSPLMWVDEARSIVGLPQKMRTQPLLVEEAAIATKKRYNDLSEIFLVIPFAPGVIGKAAFKETSDFPSDELMIGGAVMVVGSWLLGKIFYAKDLAAIRETNAQRTRSNERAQIHNEIVDQTLASHRDEVTRWKSRNEGRGVVRSRAR